MNNELLKLFDIKDDVVDTFNKLIITILIMRLILDLNLPGYIAPIVAALILSIKVIEKDLLYLYLSMINCKNEYLCQKI